MFRRILLLTVSTSTGIALAGCDVLDSTGMGEVTQLVVRLELGAEQVAPGDTVRADALVINRGTQTATVTTEAVCFGALSILREQVEQEFRSEPGACWAVESPLELEPGDSLKQSWRIEAVYADGSPYDPGTYQVYVAMDGRLERGSGIPDIMRSLEVR